MKYTIQHQNDTWLYAVYGNDRRDDYVLIAVWPGVGWVDVAIRLRPNEVSLLRESEDAFTEFVRDVTAKRDCPPYKDRRIESRIVKRSVDEIEVDTGTQNKAMHTNPEPRSSRSG